jgi:hypothetical protein
MEDKIMIQQTKKQMLTIVEALQFYRDNAIKPKYKEEIDKQLYNIAAQLQVQNINVFVTQGAVKFNFGEKVKYEDTTAIVVGMSDENEFIKIAIAVDNEIQTIDVPIVLIEKIEIIS